MPFRVHEVVVNIAQLPGFVEVGQRELSTFIQICGKLSEAAVPAIGLRRGSNGFGFKLIRAFLIPRLAVSSMLLTQAKKIPARKVLGSDAGLRKFGSVSFGAMPIEHPCNLAMWPRAVWSIRNSHATFHPPAPGHADLEAEAANEEGAPMAEEGRVLFDFR